MKDFFEPRSIAVVGASSKPGKIGHEVLRNLVRSSYKGKIYPINPREKEILGLEVYRHVNEVPSEVDLAVLIVSSTIAPDIVEECGKKDVKRAIIISGGFKEMGEEGKLLEKKVVHIAKKHGIRIIGPNCIGILDGKSGLDTFFQPHENMTRPKQGNIAILTQSGTYGASLLEWFAREEIGVSKFVSYGNKCDVDEIDMLQYLRDDKDTKVIAIYMEGLEKGRKFLDMSRRVSTKKPIVLLKSGRGREGARAAKSHTGALSMDNRIFVRVVGQAGIILVDNLEEMFDVTKILSMQPLPKEGRIGMVTNGAGPCVSAVDFIEESDNLEVARLDRESIELLEKKLPSFFVSSNPIDVTGSGMAEHYELALKLLGLDKNVDIILPFFVFQDAPLASTIEGVHEAMTRAKKYGKPLLGCAAGGEFTMTQGKRLQTHNIPMVPTARRVTSALDKIVGYSKWLGRR